MEPKNLKQAREDQGVSLRELSKATGVDAGNWSRVENGRVKPNDSDLKKVEAFLTKKYEVEFMEAKLMASVKKEIHELIWKHRKELSVELEQEGSHLSLAKPVGSPRFIAVFLTRKPLMFFV